SGCLSAAEHRSPLRPPLPDHGCLPRLLGVEDLLGGAAYLRAQEISGHQSTLPPERVSHQDAARNLLSLAQYPRIAEVHGMARIHVAESCSWCADRTRRNLSQGEVPAARFAPLTRYVRLTAREFQAVL